MRCLDLALVCVIGAACAAAPADPALPHLHEAEAALAEGSPVAAAESYQRALDAALEAGELTLSGDRPAVAVEHPRNPEHGDYATNIAMLLARPARRNPREIAGILAARLEAL